MSTTLEPVNPPGASFPGVSQGIVISGGRLMVLSGHVPTDASGNLVTGDFEVQLNAAFENVGRTLTAAGIGFESVARFTIYVTDYGPSMIPILRRVRSRFIDTATPPASALVGVAALYDSRVKVEIDALAVVP
jgi:enamine deaminase RidA (YjgF/YER057c/UK114 family)